MGMTTAATKRANLCACEFIAKPVDFDHLKAQLRQLPGAADR
jgi:hypothetical protein